MGEKLPLRPNVCIVLFNSACEILVGERHGSSGIFQFPQGGIEGDDSLEENALRELKEELSINSSSLRVRKILEATNEYDWTEVPSYAVGRWRGQSQRFVLVEFVGSDDEIIVETENPEFKGFKWCDINDVCNIVEKKRVKGYQLALRETADYFKSFKLRKV